MNQNFDNCMTMPLAHEGGFADHPSDPGCMTNLGVTKADRDEFYGGNATEEVMKVPTKRDVETIYRRNYLNRFRIQQG